MKKFNEIQIFSLKNSWLYFCLLIFFSTTAFSQIVESRGLNMPGSWNNSFQNPPSNFALASNVQVAGGRISLITTGDRRYQTIFSVNSSGADIVGGSYNWLFTTGPVGNFFQDKWANVNVTMNSFQTYTFQGGTDNSINVVNGKWYTSNWRDIGYQNTTAIFMETSAEPVQINTVTQFPLAANITPSDAVVVTANTNNSLSPEEILYLRYSTTSNYAVSTLVPFTMTGNTGTATIPAQLNGTSIFYYVFTSTLNITDIGSNYDMATIRLNNNGGSYVYTSTSLPPVDVTFRVNMNSVFVGGAVNLGGSFNGFGDAPMNPVGGGIYTLTLSLPQNQDIEYKFKNGSGFEGNLSAPCGNGGNRIYNTGNSDTILDIECFGGCGNCIDVLFQVNLSNNLPAGAVTLSGSFNNWGEENLVEQAGNIFSLTKAMAQNQNHEFKYVQNGNFEGNITGVCGNGFNRTFNTGTSNQTLPLVCLNSCSNCTAPPPTRSITFRVNMANETVGTNGMFLAGSFNGFDPTSVPMSQSGTIYSATVILNEGDSYIYKFVNDGIFESGNSGCGTDDGFGGFNRNYTVPATNATLPIFCFNQCVDCVPTGNISVTSGAWESTSTWNTGVVPAAGADVTISAGNTVTINNATTIGVATINGTLVANQNLTITGGGTVAGQLTIASNRILSVPSSTLNSTGMITLKSGASLLHGSGTTGFTGGTVTGNFRMERQGFTGIGYSFMSAPMQNVNLATLGSTRYSYITANGSSTITAGVPDGGWNLISGASTMQQAVGYAILSPGLAIMTGSNPREGTTNITVSVPGGTTNDMNLLGNPFPSAISANSFLNVNGPAGIGAVDGTIYYWDNPTPFSGPYLSSDYATWNGAGGIGGAGNTPNGNIGAGQGFFIRGLINNQTVSFTNNMRVTNNAQFFDETPIGRARFSVSTSNHYNETLIAFLNEATDGFDSRFDSEKFIGNPNLALYSKLNNTNMAIQSFGELTSYKSVNLGIQSNSNQTHILKLNELENFNPTVSIYLEDRELLINQNLRINAEYAFSTGTMSLNERFVIHFGAPIIHNISEASCTQLGSVSITSETTGVDVQLQNENGSTLYQSALDNELNIEQIASGNYTLNYLFADGYQVQVPFVINQVDQVALLGELPENFVINVLEGFTFVANTSGANEFIWTLNGEVISQTETLQYSFNTPGTYILHFEARSKDCSIIEDIEIAVKDAVITNILTLNDNELSLYPNPALDVLNITTALNSNQNVSVSIYDAAMREVLNYRLNSSNGLHQLDIHGLDAGLYTVILKSNQTQIAKRFIKQ